MKCAICEEELLRSDLGWLHKPETGCSEWDGLLIDQEVRQKWNEKYKYDGIKFSELLKEVEKWKAEAEKEKQKLQYLESKMNENNKKQKQKLSSLLKLKTKTLTNATSSYFTSLKKKKKEF